MKGSMNFFLEDDHDDDDEFKDDEFEKDETPEEDDDTEDKHDDDDDKDEDDGLNTYIDGGDDDTEDYDDTDSSDSSLSNKLAKVVYALCVVCNNIKHIHFHASGRRFDRIHAKADALSSNVYYKADRIAEFVLQFDGAKLDNLNNSATHCAEIDLETEETYNYTSGFSAMKSNYEKLIEIVKDARSAAEERTDIQSVLDGYLEDFNKETNYLMKRELASENEGSLEESCNMYI